MNSKDKKIGMFFSFIFGGIFLVIVLILLSFMFFEEERREYIKDRFTDDEPISVLYKNNSQKGNR